MAGAARARREERSSVRIKARCRSFSIQVKQTQVTRECHHARRLSTLGSITALPFHRAGGTALRHAICSQRGMSVGREEYNASVRAGSNQRRATIRWGGRFVIAAFGVELIQREAVGMVVHVLVGIMFSADASAVTTQHSPRFTHAARHRGLTQRNVARWGREASS